jgi:phenylalanyl-tRNA synthetase alpha chain
MSVEAIRKDFEEKLSKVTSLQDLESLRVAFLGKNGVLTQQMKQIANLPVEEKKAFGASVNQVKQIVEENLSSLKSELEDKELDAKVANEKIDITLTPRTFATGKEHPISKVISDVKEIFAYMGFDVADGPDLEDDWHNFTALNFPENHPARHMHDTFYVDGTRDDVLRTHTSSVQIRHMQNNKPPYKIISVGRVYRSDDDATHTPMFHQIEGLYIDKDVNMGHMKYCLETFLKLFFDVKEAPIRMRPHFFPFTEPSAEVDVKCDRSDKKEIKIGEGNDWLEILGCGMVHPNVLKNVGVDPDVYQGFAFGMGVDRLTMLKYNISDLRSFFNNDLRWLQHYGF